MPRDRKPPSPPALLQPSSALILQASEQVGSLTQPTLQPALLQPLGGGQSHAGLAKVRLLLLLLAGATMQVGVTPITLEDNHVGAEEPPR